MRPNPSIVRLVDGEDRSEQLAQAELLDRTFFALSDPVRRAILERLGEESFLVSELATPFNISLQAVSRHIQVLVRAGLIQQERTGRISRCSIDVAPIYAAAVWINRYSKYWQAQFDTLAGWITSMDRSRATKRTSKLEKPSARKRSSAQRLSNPMRKR
jgi:DNA-binding transcriptional ArsR family regulator